MPDDYKTLITARVLDEENFSKAVFKGQQRGNHVPWREVMIRPVLLKAERHLQFSYFDATKNITKNYRGPEADEALAELLAHPFKNYKVESQQGDFHVQITKKGKAIIHQSDKATPPINLSHNRRKAHLLTEDGAAPFLQAIGIMGQNGQIKASMRRKLRQINEFLRLLEETIEMPRLKSQDPLHIVDFGCGNAYLTFATYYYFEQILGLPTSLTGVDTKADLMIRHLHNSQTLGWQNLSFVPTSIIDYKTDAPPHIVLALHACDTATDEALAQGIGWESDYILSAPCCHNHLQQQLRQRPTPNPFQPVLRQGILRERLGDILTDTLRALILQIMGYKTEVIEFVSSEHTAKNIMIRATRSARSGQPQAIEEYQALKSFWGVTPYLEELLGETLSRYLTKEGN